MLDSHMSAHMHRSLRRHRARQCADEKISRLQAEVATLSLQLQSWEQWYATWAPWSWRTANHHLVDEKHEKYADERKGVHEAEDTATQHKKREDEEKYADKEGDVDKTEDTAMQHKKHEDGEKYADEDGDVDKTKDTATQRKKHEDGEKYANEERGVDKTEDSATQHKKHEDGEKHADEEGDVSKTEDTAESENANEQDGEPSDDENARLYWIRLGLTPGDFFEHLRPHLRSPPPDLCDVGESETNRWFHGLAGTVFQKLPPAMTRAVRLRMAANVSKHTLHKFLLARGPRLLRFAYRECRDMLVSQILEIVYESSNELQDTPSSNFNF